MRIWALACLLVWGARVPVAAAGEADAALLQVHMWLDLGELGRAVALSRRGAKQLDDELGWHQARLASLSAARMQPWITAEYAEHPRSDAARLAYAIWQVDQGLTLGLPAWAQGEQADLARARWALARGDRALAQQVAWSGTTAAHLALRVQVAADADDDALLVEAVSAWPEEDDTPLVGLAPALQHPKPSRALKAALEVQRGRIQQRLAEGQEPLSILQVSELGLALSDKEMVLAAFGRLRAIQTGPQGLQAEFDGFMKGPAAWTVWQVPPRPRWGGTLLDVSGSALARRVDPTLPWGRPDERARMAVSTAEALQKRGRVLEADRLLADALGACAASLQADLLVATGRKREGRDRAESDLLHCVGGTDVVPTSDVAGFDVEAAFEHAASAWFTFGRVAEMGGWSEDAALALGIAARLGPTEERVARARIRAKAAGLPTDATGVPSVQELAERLDQAVWLRPASAMLASRARFARERTLALLAPTPEHLTARMLPESSCMPTIRARCMLERAVAVVAHERARRPPPERLEDIPDAGARRAAPLWLDAVEQGWFQRTAALGQIARKLSGSTVDLQAILEGQTGMSLGRPAPTWRSGGLTSADMRGRVVVLSFWASWCRPCFAELPLVDALAAQWEAEGVPVRVFAVSVDAEDLRYRKALAKLTWSSMSVFRDDGLRKPFAVDVLPTIVVIGPDGVLRSHHVGYEGGNLSWLDEAVRTWAPPASSGTRR